MPNKIDELYNNLDNKIDGIREDISEIKVTSAKHELTLQDHIRRTEINEERLSLFEEKALPALESYRFVAKFLKIASSIIIFTFTIFGIYHEYFK